jgi:recombinational DNA repair ATPase RecF
MKEPGVILFRSRSLTRRLLSGQRSLTWRSTRLGSHREKMRVKSANTPLELHATQGQRWRDAGSLSRSSQNSEH